VRPGELPGGAEPCIVEVRHVRAGQVFRDRFQGRGEQPGRLPDGGGERAGRRRAPEHLRQGPAGAVPGQELAVPQVDARAHDPRPVLHRSRHPGRRSRLRLVPAAARQREQLMLGDLRLHRGDVDDLAAFGPGHGRALQGLPAAPARRRPVPHPLIRMIAELHRRPGLALGPARPAAGLPPQRLRRRLRQPVRRRRLRGVPGVRLHLRRQALDLRLQRRQRLPQRRDLRILLPQDRDLRVPLRQEFPQPRVRSTKPRSIIGDGRHLGHAPNYTMPPPSPQIGKRRTRCIQGKHAGDQGEG